MAVDFRHEEITGSDLTGSDGAKNRVYTLEFEDSLQSNFQLVVSGQILQANVHYTLVDDDVTFLNNTFDAQVITIDYLTSPDVLSPSVVYCDSNDVEAELLLATGTFDASSQPTLSQVNLKIANKSEKIDRDLRHAWREVVISDKFYTISPRSIYYFGAGVRIPLKHREIRTLDTNEGDKIEIWNGSEYVDFLTAKTEGRADDFWMDLKGGNLYLRKRLWIYFEKPARLSFRYGASTVPNDIQELCAKMVAKDILVMEDNSFVLAETESGRNMNYDQRVVELRRDIKETKASRAAVFHL